jgi:hypothetical protein
MPHGVETKVNEDLVGDKKSFSDRCTDNSEWFLTTFFFAVLMSRSFSLSDLIDFIKKIWIWMKEKYLNSLLRETNEGF